MVNNDKKFLDEHFYYELWMLHDSFKNLQKSKVPSYPCNLFLEATLIHFRCLTEFYYYDKSYPSDARAYEFVANIQKWQSDRKNRDFVISKFGWDRLNQELAHLTWNRIAGIPPEKDWWKTLSDSLPKLIEITEIFLADMKPQIKLVRVPGIVAQLKTELDL